LYVGTDKGLFFSTNGGTTWQVMASGLPNVQVRELAIDLDHNLLAAGTYGRGLWEIGLAG
jgi:xyloglucan-specific exo-beta-1,4-glucanase